MAAGTLACILTPHARAAGKGAEAPLMGCVCHCGSEPPSSTCYLFK